MPAKTKEVEGEASTGDDGTGVQTDRGKEVNTN